MYSRLLSLIVILSVNEVSAQSDTLYFDFAGNLFIGHTISSISEITFSLGNDSIYIKGTNSEYNNYLLSNINELSFSVISGHTPLPVELVNFNGYIFGSNVLLSWQTLSETNNYGFEIEKQTDIKWNKIAFVRGAGTTTETQNYSYETPKIDLLSTYRLKQIDLNGSFVYSSSITIDGNIRSFSINQNYPNPFNPSTTLEFNLPSNGNLNISIYDINGKLVANILNEYENAGTFKLNWNLNKQETSSISSGIYFIRAKFNQSILSKKILIMK